jgi:hypothetical protein
LGRDFERMGQIEYNASNVKEAFQKWEYDAGKSDEDTSVGSHQVHDHSFTCSQEKVIDEGRRDKFTGSLSPSQRIKMMQLLDYWDEPETVRTRHVSQQSRCFRIVYVHSLILSLRLFWHRAWRQSTLSFNSGNLSCGGLDNLRFIPTHFLTFCTHTYRLLLFQDKHLRLWTTRTHSPWRLDPRRIASHALNRLRRYTNG